MAPFPIISDPAFPKSGRFDTANYTMMWAYFDGDMID
jgi:hypothetical protein